jgi:uncharacterized protein YecT (DUF1311 family)
MRGDEGHLEAADEEAGSQEPKAGGSCLAEHSRERHKALNGNEEQILEKFETF